MILINKNTTQAPLTTVGLTGQQSTSFVPAPRVYIRAPDPTLINGVYFGPAENDSLVSAGFTDLGVVDGNATVTLTNTAKPILSTVNGRLSKVVTTERNAEIGFSLAQVDDSVVQQITGLAPFSSSASYANYLVGTQAPTQVSLMLVLQNKLDGKEWQFYNPAALLTYSLTYSTESVSCKVTAVLPGFPDMNGNTNQVLSISIFAPNSPTYIAGWGETPYGQSWGT